MKTIKAKIRASFIFIILVSGLGGAASYVVSDKTNAFQENKNNVDRLLLNWAEARKSEKEFILNDRKSIDFLEKGTSLSVEKSKEHTHKFNQVLSELKSSIAAEDEYVLSKLTMAGNLMNEYENTFEELVKEFHQRGFKDHGLEGEMRSFVHNLQKGISSEEKVFALTLRKHEKDYMLRKDTRYIQKLQNTAKEYKRYITESTAEHATAEYKEQMLGYISAYANQFDKIVKSESKIGFVGERGLISQLSEISTEIQPVADELQFLINAKVERAKAYTMFFLLASIGIMILIGVFMTIYYARIISNPISWLDGKVKSFIENKESFDTEALKSLNKDEIGNLTYSFKDLAINIKSNLQDISEKNKALELKSLEDEKRNWSNEGLAQFADVIKSSFKSLDDLAFETLMLLIKYTGSNQGGIFIKNEERDVMELQASYAYDRKKYLTKEIEKGEGLLGAAWLEQDKIYMSDIPDNYINITSGFGDANPNYLLIVPVMTDNNVEGLIELAAFKDFGPHTIELIENIASRLATTISSVKTQNLTNRLLEKSKVMTEQLQASEEELRQNMEELQSTQEEMSRSNGELQEKMAQYQLYYELYDHVLSSFFDGFIVINKDYSIEYIDDAFTKLGFFKKENLIGQHIGKLFNGNHLAIHFLTNAANMYSSSNENKALTNKITLHDERGNEWNTYVTVVEKKKNEENVYCILFRLGLDPQNKREKNIQHMIN
ncbi:GAF domain-containing protein [Flammeovirgaceae bacterium SG7u.111]|nr:GAF domain-containing protein [Flammeovirgaceae bacterium SG7u.132]WPO34592.1 GAF domain-containing protein [Flammeovirgaceae bacterium SG7u.111]